MSMDIHVEHHGLHLLIRVDPAGRPLLLHVGVQPPPADLPADPGAGWALVQLHGEQPGRGWVFHATRGARHGQAIPGIDLVYTGHRWADEADGGRRLEIDSALGGLRVRSLLRFPARAPAVQIVHTVENTAEAPFLIEGLPALSWRGAAGAGGPWEDRLRVLRCAHGWFAELRWQELAPREAGLVRGHVGAGASAAIRVANTGSWSAKDQLPMGGLLDHEAGTCLLWQIEHSGGWSWELGDDGGGHLLLAAGGPDQRQQQWCRELKQGETFASVPVALALVRGGIEEGMAALNRYRRAERVRFADHAALPVIFNDYMNCLFADPTTAKELPLIDAAARAGCETYVIDAGWYADAGRSWWDTIGAWREGAGRFPDGLPALLQRIRAAGMTPGLWLELEAMGVNCPLAATLPRDWFFQRRGRLQVFSGRYQLDFRNPAVRAHADEVVDRLVGWGCGYIKMDYNIDSGVGTDLDADSAGDGALRHIRAYWAWLDAVHARHPLLVVENCSSGGLRMDWGQLRRHAIQSTSDQEDWRLTPYIAAAAVTAAPPEQQAVWSYPKREGDREETIANLVNAVLLRIHQSGHLADLAPERFSLVAEGIAVHKAIRGRIAQAQPRWPWGLPRWGDPRCAYGLEDDQGLLLAVWRLGAPEARQVLTIPSLRGRPATAHCLYPAGDAAGAWDATAGTLTVDLPAAFSARLFAIDLL